MKNKGRTFQVVFSMHTIELDRSLRSRSRVHNAKLDKGKLIRKGGQING